MECKRGVPPPPPELVLPFALHTRLIPPAATLLPVTLRPVLGLAGLTLLALVIAACAPQVAPELLAAAAQNRTQPDVPAEAWAWPQAAEEVPLRPRPTGAPDVVVIAFAGHCGLVCRTRNTWSYLDDPGEATGEVAVLDAILRAFRRQSLTAEGILAVIVRRGALQRDQRPVRARLQ